MRRTLSVLVVTVLVLVAMPALQLPGSLAAVALAAPDDDIPGVPLEPFPGGTLDAAGDRVAVYSVRLYPGTVFTCDVGGSSPLDADLWLYPPGTATVIGNFGAAVAWATTIGDDTLTYVVPPGAGGVYYLEVWGFTGAGNYGLDWDPPNDLPGLTPGVTNQSSTGPSWTEFGTIEQGVDAADVYTVRLTPGDRLQVTGFAATATNDLSLSLWSSTDSSIWGPWDFEDAESDGFTYPESFSYTCPPGQAGEYHLAVKPEESGLMNYWVRYEIIEDGTVPSVRLAGDDRIKTAVRASGEGFPQGSEYVIVVTGYNWPDALSAAGLAGVLHCPILLTHPDALSADTLAEIKRLGANQAYIIGGTAAVGQQVADDLINELGPGGVSRIAGADRYQTSYNVAAEMNTLMTAEGRWIDTDFFVATGANFPDALAVGPLAADFNWPSAILLHPPTESLSPAAEQVISSIWAAPGWGHANIIGGTDVVSSGVENDLKALAILTGTNRYAGHDRYATADAVIRAWQNAYSVNLDTIAIALGTNYPDALCAASLQATSHSFVLLSRADALPPEARTFLAQNKAAIETVRLVGGSDVLSNAVRNDAVSLTK